MSAARAGMFVLYWLRELAEMWLESWTVGGSESHKKARGGW